MVPGLLPHLTQIVSRPNLLLDKPYDSFIRPDS